MIYTVRKIIINELPKLTELFDYNDIDKMIAENASRIKNSLGDIFIILDGEKLIGELHVSYESKDKLEAVRGVRAYLYAYRIHKNFQGMGLGNCL